MRVLIHFLILNIAVICYGQNYPGVTVSDKKQIDEDNVLFVPGRTFLYSITGPSNSTTFPEEVSYTVMSIKKSKKLLKNQTEVTITTKPFNNRIETTGVIENVHNLWVHPPRTGSFNDLSLCPFPYVKFPLDKGKTWVDENTVGDQWSNGRWQGKIPSKIQYEVIDKQVVKTDKLSYDYWVISATIESEIGNASALFHFNENLGFIHMSFATLEGELISFTLKDTIDSTPLKSQEELLYRIKRN